MPTTSRPPIARAPWLLVVLPAAVACGAFSGTGANLEDSLGGPSSGADCGEPGPGSAGTQPNPSTNANDGADTNRPGISG